LQEEKGFEEILLGKEMYINFYVKDDEYHLLTFKQVKLKGV